MVKKIKKRAVITLPAKASVFYTLTGAFERGINVLFTPIFTRLLTPGEYGVYPLYTSWLGILTVFLSLELSGSIIYRALTKYRAKQYELIMNSYIILSFLSALAFLIVGIFPELFENILSLPRKYIYFLILQIFINGVINLYISLCKYSYRYKLPALINLLNAFISPALAFLFIYSFNIRNGARIISPLIIGIIIALPLFIYVLRSADAMPSADIIKYLLSLSLPLLPHFLSLTVMSQSGKIFIGKFYGEEAVAKYSLVFSVGFLFTLFTTGIQSSLLPWINRKLSHGAGNTVDLLCERLFKLFSLISLLSITFMREGLLILAPREYSDALVAVYPISISVLLSFLSTILYTVIVYYGRSYYVTLSSIASAIISIGLHLLITRRLSYLGAALTQAIGSLILVILYAIILGGVLKKNSFKPINYVKIILFAIAISTLIFIFRTSIFSRILLFIAIFLMAIPQSIDLYRLVREK